MSNIVNVGISTEQQTILKLIAMTESLIKNKTVSINSLVKLAIDDFIKSKKDIKSLGSDCKLIIDKFLKELLGEQQDKERGVNK